MSSNQNNEAGSQHSLPLFSHLIELRDRILRIVATVMVIFLSLVYFANDIYHYLAIPLTSQL
ncbi:MAG: twin-arginine translocase subunit TatC, partial [Psychromonas sp.]